MPGRDIRVRTEEDVHRIVPRRLWDTAFGLINLDFIVSYEGPQGQPRAIPGNPPRGRLRARKNGVHLRVVISWLASGREEVCFYQRESVAGNLPNLTRRKQKTFWKVAKHAGR